MGCLLDASALLKHLSLSLSLYSGFSSAPGGAQSDLLAGSSRAFGCGFSPVRARPATTVAAPCACIHAPAVSGRRGASRSRTQRAKCASHTSERGRGDAPPIVALRLSLGGPPHNPWGTSEEVPSRAPSRAGSEGPMRRGPVPNPGPRRSLLCVERGVRGRGRSGFMRPSFVQRGGVGLCLSCI
jgi:hypothetical protein